MNGKSTLLNSAVASYELTDLEEGMSVHCAIRVSRKDVNAFAELSGDINPLHVDLGYGQESKFGCNIAHGMLIVSFFSMLIGVFLPGRNALLSNMDVRYIKPVPVDSEIIVSGRVVAIEKAQNIIALRLLAFLDGEVCVHGRGQVKMLPAQGII